MNKITFLVLTCEVQWLLVNKKKEFEISGEEYILKCVVNISPLVDNVLYSHDLRIYGFE